MGVWYHWLRVAKITTRRETAIWQTGHASNKWRCSSRLSVTKKENDLNLTIVIGRHVSIMRQLRHLQDWDKGSLRVETKQSMEPILFQATINIEICLHYYYYYYLINKYFIKLITYDTADCTLSLSILFKYSQ